MNDETRDSSGGSAHDPTLPNAPGWRKGAANHDEGAKGDVAAGAAWERSRDATPAVDPLEWAKREAGERYRVARAAGAGGHSLVFEAFDLKLERSVAIKFLRGSLAPGAPAPDHDLTRALLDEARAMARLRHEGLCPVHEIETSRREPFLVMEWIDGVTLDEAWSGLPRDQMLVLFTRVVDAVAVLHAGRVVHGDLKPSNVLVDRRGRPVVVDFGLASRGGGVRGRPFGTPGFAAPEQLEREGRVEAASDVFALGAMLYLLLTGRSAIADSTVEACRARALAVDYPLPQERAPDVPAGLQRICLTALEPDAKRRYPDAAAMLLDLQRWRRGEEVVARPSILQGRFFDQVETTLAHVERWRTQALVTDRESNALVDLLRRIRRPDSYWLADARRLIPSQVMLYLGGWISLVALTVGMWLAWESFDAAPWLRWAIPGATALVLAAVGLWLRSHGEPRIALGFLVVVDLAIAVSLVQLFRETEWLAPALESRATSTSGDAGSEVVERAELSAADREDPDTREPAKASTQIASIVMGGDLSWRQGMGAWNAQLLVGGAIWLAATLLIRRLSGSSALTPMASLAGFVVWVSAWAVGGGVDARDDDRMALTGVWLAAGGAVALAWSLRRNRREEAVERDAGEGVAPQRDAWSAATLGTLSILAGLALAAAFRPDLWTLHLVDAWSRSRRIALAFMVASLAVFALTALLQRRRTPLRARLATGVRLIAPTWWLLPLVVLERESGGSDWILWEVLLFASIFVVAAMSAFRNWKPLLLSSLVYFAVGYVQLVQRLAAELSGRDEVVARTVMIAALALGLLMMAAAYVAPRWRTRRA